MDDSIKRRLRALEVASRRSRLLAAGALAAVAVLLAAAWTPRPAGPTEVQATRFTLVDAAGKVRGVWELRNGDPVLELLDAGGAPRVTGYIKQGVACLLLRDAEHRSRLGLTVDNLGNPQQLLLDEGQVPRVSLTLSERGLGNLRMTTAEGHTPVGLGFLTDGAPWLRPSETHDGGDWGKPRDGR
ncbi:MAG: hypothetical protein IPM29_20135 [Planctomycetes bacterium]|nr:hypothetical protein [Planctomycetota bacterium]